MAGKYIESYQGVVGSWAFAADVAEEFQDIEVGFDALEAETDAMVKISGANAAGELPLASSRVNKFVRFVDLGGGSYPPAMVDPASLGNPVIVPMGYLEGGDSFTATGDVIFTTLQNVFTPMLTIAAAPVSEIILGQGEWSFMFIATAGNPAGVAIDAALQLQKGVGWTPVRTLNFGNTDWGNWTENSEKASPLFMHHHLTVAGSQQFRYRVVYSSGSAQLDLTRVSLTIIRWGD